MKKGIWGKVSLALLLLLILVRILVNCDYFTWHYHLQQPLANITAVTIMETTYYEDKSSNYGAAKELTLEEGKKLISELLALECGHNSPNLSREFGNVFVEITYENSMREIIGYHINAWINTDGKMHYGPFYFKGNTYYTIVKSYL